MASAVKPSKVPSPGPRPPALIQETAHENHPAKPSQPTERCEIVIRGHPPILLCGYLQHGSLLHPSMQSEMVREPVTKMGAVVSGT